MKTTLAFGTCCVAAFLGSACSREQRRDIHSARPEARAEDGAVAPSSGTEGTTGAPAAPEVTAAGTARRAEADFAALPGSKLDAEAELEEVSNGVLVRVQVDGAPKGMKAIHIHENGDCSNIPKDSMGQHFNPAATAHGLPESREHHAGDLGNIVVQGNGDGKLEVVATNVNLRGDDPMSILNRALVIHENEDVGTQPAGGAGRPIACAVIRER